MRNLEEFLFLNNVGKDEREHSRRVANYAANFGICFGLSKQNSKLLYELALLHDIGKGKVSRKILDKEGPLNDFERKIIESHSILGQGCIKFVPALKEWSHVIRAHHERWDGKGYPDGLSKKSIPLFSRIISVADVYDALTSVRPYRKKAYSMEEAIKIIADGSGLQFDPEITRFFIENIFSIVEINKAKNVLLVRSEF